MVSKIWNWITFQRKKVSLGKGVYVRGFIFVHGRKGGISLGDNCTIYSSENVNPTSGFNHTHLTVGEGASLSIGKNVGMSHVNITANKKVMIEDNVLIGSGVKIWDCDFHPLDYSERMNKPDAKGSSKEVLIGEGAFIGACSIILKGVHIGKHSIVGAGSVVTKDIPENEIWGGNPAKYIRGGGI